jgi:hypothetical protein
MLRRKGRRRRIRRKVVGFLMICVLSRSGVMNKRNWMLETKGKLFFQKLRFMY